MFDPLVAIAIDSARIADLVDRTPAESRVPSCPDWSFLDLVTHVGLVQRFWAENVRAANPTAPWDGEESMPRPGPDVAGWLRDCTESLLAALREAAADAPCWTWWGEPRTAAAVARHQVQEAAVHRWDAELSGGTPSPIDADVAHDGVGEFLEVVLGTAASSVPGGVTLVATDTRGRWQTGGGGPSSVTVRATASDLVLLLYRRLRRSALEVDGDVAVLDALLAAADTE
ncbi:MAG: maleylpyruvate isomerase family mycothiol-dependent enzyme [Acidimicrobiales bacterium]